MRFFTCLLVVIVLSILARLALPWWSIIPAAALAGFLIPLKGRWAFAAGFLGLLILWGGYAAYIDSLNEGILSNRMGLLLGGMSSSALIAVTALLGGLFGGLGALSGNLARILFR